MRACSAGITAADRERAVPGQRSGRQPAVRRRVLRRSCQSGRGECPAGACARPAERAIRHPRPPEYVALAVDAPDGARRAPRAFNVFVKKFLTGKALDRGFAQSPGVAPVEPHPGRAGRLVAVHAPGGSKSTDDIQPVMACGVVRARRPGTAVVLDLNLDVLAGI
jgi:hypothetical protein